MRVLDSYNKLIDEFNDSLRAVDAEMGRSTDAGGLNIVGEAIKAKHPSLLAVDTKDGCSAHCRINPVYDRIVEWRKIFLHAGVKPQDIAEVCMSDMPESLTAYNGQFYMRVNNVTEEQFKMVTELRIHTDGKVMHKDDYICPWTHDEFWRANGVEGAILTQLRTIHRTKAAMVAELQQYITANEALLKKTCSSLFDTETVFNGDETDEDRDSIVDLIADGNVEDAGMRLFALDQYGPGPCPEEDGNEPTDADYDEYYDCLFDAADHWLDTPEEWTAYRDAEREKFIKAHPELKNGCVECQAEEDERGCIA